MVLLTLWFIIWHQPMIMLSMNMCGLVLAELKVTMTLTHLCGVGSSTTTFWTGLFPITWCLVSFDYYLCFLEILVFNANSVDPDQTPHSAAADLALHCLPDTLLRVSRQKRGLKHFGSIYNSHFIITLPLSWYDVNNGERDVKHQIIIIMKIGSRLCLVQTTLFLY